MRPTVPMLALAAVIVIGLALPRAARADETVADSLFQEGQAAMKRRDFKAACDAFAGSHKADPAPGTLINIGICSEKQNKIASAWSAYNGARELALQKGQNERAAAAKAEADRLAQRVQKVQIEVRGAYEDLEVKRDGQVVPTEALAFPIALDVGKHHVDVVARGKKPRGVDFEIKDLSSGGHAIEAVTVQPLEDAPVVATASGSKESQPGGAAPDGSGQRTAGLIVAGSGLLAGLAAIGVVVLAGNEESKATTFRDQQDKPADPAAICTNPDACKADYNSHHSASKNDQLIAIILGAGGVVLLGVGGYLYFTAPHGTKTGRPLILPRVGPGYAGASLGLSF